jgi:hypothetical protein
VKTLAMVGKSRVSAMKTVFKGIQDRRLFLKERG